MQMVHGTFLGTGATIYIGLGFVPDYVELFNLADIERVEYWSNLKRGTGIAYEEGIANADGAGDADLALAAGVAPYLGGYAVETANEAYAVHTDCDQRGSGTTGAKVKRWTLDTVADKSGHFDINIGAEVLAGSEVVIDGVSYWIILKANDGDAADDIDLNAAAPNGRVDYIGKALSFTACPAGRTMPAGFSLPSGNMNTDAQQIVFRAGHY